MTAEQRMSIVTSREQWQKYFVIDILCIVYQLDFDCAVAAGHFMGCPTTTVYITNPKETT
jgi:hypothetical protein